ncbi:MAG: galactokinase [Chryseolinea sp.]
MINSDSLPRHPAKLNPEEVRKRYRALYHQEPIMVRSPGRINLIGEHTDYNDGFVMPAGIDREMVLAIGLAGGQNSSLHSLRQNETITFDIANPSRLKSPLWANFMLGVARRFLDKGYTLQAFNCVMDGDIPTGAGLSSSAALECGFAFALDHLHGFKVPRIEMVQIAQWAEHNYAGVMCGIMDQFASMMSQENQAFVLDCRSLNYQYFTLQLQDYAILLCDTMVKHTLATSAYNERREQCESGVKILKQFYPEIKSLRDVTIEMIDHHASLLNGKILDRCRYVVEENQRVLDASHHLTVGDLAAFGKKMYASHEGLSRLYEVSCNELDFLVDEARRCDVILGSRMMGGGFGGCTINIILKSAIPGFISRLSVAYRSKFNTEMDHYVVALRGGTSLLQTN